MSPQLSYLTVALISYLAVIVYSFIVIDIG